MNKNDKIMTQHFTERFINHHDVGIAREAVAEFPLHHAESGFDVAQLLEQAPFFHLEISIHERRR